MINLKKLLFALWLFAGVLFVCGSCHGQVFLVKAEVQSCTAFDCRVELGVSSSVCVGNMGDRWYFVTAGHTFWSDRPGVLQTKVRSAHVAIDRQWVEATVEGFDSPTSGSDLGLLSVQSPSPLRALPIAAVVPQVGAQVVIGGFPSGSPYAEVRGRVVSATPRDGKSDFAVSTAVVRGVSGGPVLVEGKIAGIVSASDFGSGTWAVGPEKIRARLVKHLGRIPDCGRPAPVAPQEHGPAVSSAASTVNTPSPPAPARVEPPSASPRADDESSAAGASSLIGWLRLFSVLVPALGLGGPIGIGIGAAGWLVARKLRPRVATRVRNRRAASDQSHDDQQRMTCHSPACGDSSVAAAAPAFTKPVSVVQRPLDQLLTGTQNRFVEVPVMNNEAEALKEAMRLEAEFTRNDNPQIAMHLRRVQEMADLILQGKRIEKPGWKSD